MSNIFLSWSGERSKYIAKYLVNWLPTINPYFDPWMSADHIGKGEQWAKSIESKLVACPMGVAVVTPENMDAPWINFEAGMLGRACENSKMIPLVFGMDPGDLIRPLQLFQITACGKEDLGRMVLDLNAMMGDRMIKDNLVKQAFEKNWPELEACLDTAMKIEIEGDVDDIESVIKALGSNGLPDPEMFREASFYNGFESHGLYSSAMAVAQKRLLIFGRKNRKVFDKEHRAFYQSLAEKCAKGFDFRCLFLDPDAPEDVLHAAHQDAGFPAELQRCVNGALDVMESIGVPANDHFRTYAFHRDSVVVVVDNAVLFCPVERDEDGVMQPLTKTGFRVVNGRSKPGQRMLDLFEQTWNEADALER